MQTIRIEAFDMIGIALKTTNQNAQAGQDIAALWERFLGEGLLAQIPNKVDDTIYSLYTDYEGDYTQPYLAMLGCRVEKVEDIPEGMIAKQFAGGEYAKFSARGDLQKGLIVKKWQEIWRMDLNRAYTADFEVFGPKAMNPADAEVDFMIAVR